MSQATPVETFQTSTTALQTQDDIPVPVEVPQKSVKRPTGTGDLPSARKQAASDREDVVLPKTSAGVEDLGYEPDINTNDMVSKNFK